MDSLSDLSPVSLPGSETPAPTTGVEGFFHDFAEACARAGEKSDWISLHFEIGGETVEVRFAGRALVPYVEPAFQHLAVPPTRIPRLVIDVWDASTTGSFPPPFPMSMGRGEIRSVPGAGVRAVFHSGARPDGAFRSLTTFTRATATAQHFVTSPDKTEWWERAAPFRAVFHWAFEGAGRLLVHSAAVARRDTGRAALLTGAGGSGKSTSAVGACIAGLDYLGDDYVLVDLRSPPLVHSIYGTAKLAPGSVELLQVAFQQIVDRFDPSGGDGGDGGDHSGRMEQGGSDWRNRNDGAEPADRSDHPGAGRERSEKPQRQQKPEKLVVEVARLRPDGLRRSAELAAIVLPNVRPGAATRLRPATAGAALQALAPSTVFQSPERDGSALHRLAILARGLPCYWLDLGGDPGEVGPLLADLLA